MSLPVLFLILVLLLAGIAFVGYDIYRKNKNRKGKK